MERQVDDLEGAKDMMKHVLAILGAQNLGTSLPMSKLTWQDVLSWFWQLEQC